MGERQPPELSVITATLNVAEQLTHLYRSLLAQDFESFEWVIVDGCSTDGTVEILKKMVKESPWVRVISEPDCGLYDAINKGIRVMRGKRYVVAGADDAFDPSALGKFYAVAVRTGADVVVARVRIDGNESGWYRPSRRWISAARVFGGAHSVGMLFSISLHKEFGYYSREYRLLSDGFFLKTLLNSGRVRFSAADFVAGDFNSGGLTGRNRLQTLVETWLIQMRTERSSGLQTLLFLGKLLIRYPKIRTEMRRQQRARAEGSRAGR